MVIYINTKTISTSIQLNFVSYLRVCLYSFSFNPTERLTVWSTLIGIGFNAFSTYSATQPVFQRYSNVKSMTKARL